MKRTANVRLVCYPGLLPSTIKYELNLKSRKKNLYLETSEDQSGNLLLAKVHHASNASGDLPPKSPSSKCETVATGNKRRRQKIKPVQIEFDVG